MLPFYAKVVRAGKITGIDISPTRSDPMRVFISCGDDCFEVDLHWVKKYQPSVGGYFVIRPGDYAHYSPACVFEEKYKKSAP